MDNEPKLVRIQHTCFECHNLYTKPQSLRKHLRRHGIRLPPSKIGVRRYDNEDFTFVKTQSDDPTIVTHIGCPACIAHYPDAAELKTHYIDQHSDTLSARSSLLTAQSTRPPPQPTRPPPQPARPPPQPTRPPPQSSPPPASPPPLSPSSQVIEHTDDVILAPPLSSSSTASTSQSTTTRKRQSSLDRELLDSASLYFPLPDHDDHLMVQESFDVTVAFHCLQMSIVTHQWKLPLEKHLDLAFAATSMLLLSHRHYPSQPYFTPSNYEATMNHIDDRYTLKIPKMDMIKTIAMVVILQDLNTKEITRHQAIIRLQGLDLPAHQYKFCQGVENLVRKLPPLLPLPEPMTEYELITRYIDPFLSGLFDDQDNGLYFHWTNQARQKTEDTWTTRSDLCISRSNMDCGFGQVSSAHRGDYVACQDLLRLGMCCKKGLDEQNMEGVLGIQVVGRIITFYLLALPATGIYVMRELATVEVPSSIKDLPKLVLDMPRVLLVLDVFDRICIPSPHPPSPDRHTPTIDPSIINAVFSRDRKRVCSLQHCQH